MTELEKRLQELHGEYCDNGFMGDSCSAGCEFSDAIWAAARIGAELERELCVKEATEDWPKEARWPYALHDPRSVRCFREVWAVVRDRGMRITDVNAILETISKGDE